MRRPSWLLFSLLLLVAVGCQNSAAKAERPNRTKVYKSIVSLSPGTTEIFAIGADASILKGRTQACNWPTGVTSVPVVASVKPDYEKLQEIKPDLIIYDAALYSEADVQKLKQTTNAEMFAISANTIDDFTKQLHELGAMVASEIRMNDQVTKIHGERNDSTGASAAAPKVAVLLPGEGTGDMIAGTGSFVADAVRVAGGEPVGPDAEIFVKSSPEALISLNPDIIVVPGTKENIKGAMSILQNPQYRTLNAVKNRKVRVLNGDVLLRRGGRVDQLLTGLRRSIYGEEGGA